MNQTADNNPLVKPSPLIGGGLTGPIDDLSLPKGIYQWKIIKRDIKQVDAQLLFVLFALIILVSIL